MEKPINALDSKKSLENYLQKVLQTFVDSTGICIEEIRVNSMVDPNTNKRTIKQVKALEDTQVVTAAWS